MTSNPLDLLSRSDRERLERAVRGERYTAADLAAMFIEEGLRALKMTGRGMAGSTAEACVRRVIEIARRG